MTGFLRVARLQRMSLVTLSPEELLAGIRDRQEAGANLAGLDLELVLDSPLPEITGDPEVLGQALQNLVVNATQALPSRDGKVRMRGGRVGDELHLSVEDTGSPGTSRNGSSTSTSLPRKGAPAWGSRWRARRWKCTMEPSS